MDLNRIRANSRRVKWVLGLVMAVALTGTLSTLLVQVRAPVPPSDAAIASVTWSGLPPQGRQVMEQIREGGPFRYEKDGTVFGNRERLLPGQKRGFYREYTVPTPGLSHRGARRIVCGGMKPRDPDACYYTEDHYSSFRLIVQ
ncbi:ribonuclease domain-containing protein [Hydrogenophaga sp.]|uniref:ribonuclease domain-containing protein n=1 Tax=Hydrogenophaga sp. TaxID=1904254 RepID=UPI0035222380